MTKKTPFITFILGFVTGLVVCAAAAVWITKAPIPFVTKVQHAQSAVDEAHLDGRLDPNQKLYTDGQGIADTSGPAEVATVDANKTDEADLEKTKFWIHAGAYSRNADAESMRARIAFIGLDARISYNNEGGQRLYRVRVGPFETEEQAKEVKQTLSDNSIHGSIIRLKVQ